jgi:hypothetical protein
LIKLEVQRSPSLGCRSLAFVKVVFLVLCD